MSHTSYYSSPLTARTALLSVVMILCAAATAFAGGAIEIEEDRSAPEGHAVYRFEGGYVDLSVEGENLRVEVKGPTDGWVAVGFDPESRMLGANFIIGYVNDSGVRVEDHYGHSATGHRQDSDHGGSEDILERSGSEDESGTTLTFLIPLDSGDERDRPLQSGAELLMLVAYGPRGADNLTAVHAGRGSVRVRVP